MTSLTDKKITDNATLIWAVANTLRNKFKAADYGKVILPMTVLRRLDCIVDPIADKLKEQNDAMPENFTPEMRVKMLNKAANARFHSVSGLTLNRMLADPDNAVDNLKAYINGLSENIRDVFIEHFDFFSIIDRMERAGVLYSVVGHFAGQDLSPQAVSTIEMGYIFENLLRRFNEASNAESGEHFTPREVISLMTSLLFAKDGEVLASEPRVISIHDPACGTGGMLSTAENYLKELNSDLDVQLFGQEVNPESYATCRSDMLITGHDPNNIRFGNTLNDDQFKGEVFSYQISNPPYGVSYDDEYKAVEAEHKRGTSGRFVPGIPRKTDGQLLFLLHMISKMPIQRSGRIAIIMNGSPLFNGDAGSGESEIRRYLMENDMVDAIIALPTSLFYNTGISTYIWIVTNQKSPEDAGKVRLIDATEKWTQMSKSLGDKRREISASDISKIVALYSGIESDETVKVLAPQDFGYRKINVERPLRLDVDLGESEPGRFRNASDIDEYFLWFEKTFGEGGISQLADIQDEIKEYVSEAEGLALLEADEVATDAEKKSARKNVNRILKSLLDGSVHEERKELITLVRSVREKTQNSWMDYNRFVVELVAEHTKIFGRSMKASRIKAIRAWVAQVNPDAERVIDREVCPPDWVEDEQLERYGYFNIDGRTVQFERDGGLSDTERVPLGTDIVEYLEAEVLSHVGDAWINGDKRDPNDGRVGIIGYEINFNRYFYKYITPRPLDVIDQELKSVESEIAILLEEVAQ